MDTSFKGLTKIYSEIIEILKSQTQPVSYKNLNPKNRQEVYALYLSDYIYHKGNGVIDINTSLSQYISAKDINGEELFKNTAAIQTDGISDFNQKSYINKYNEFLNFVNVYINFIRVKGNDHFWIDKARGEGISKVYQDVEPEEKCKSDEYILWRGTDALKKWKTYAQKNEETTSQMSKDAKGLKDGTSLGEFDAKYKTEHKLMRIVMSYCDINNRDKGGNYNEDTNHEWVAKINYSPALWYQALLDFVQDNNCGNKNVAENALKILEAEGNHYSMPSPDHQKLVSEHIFCRTCEDMDSFKNTADNFFDEFETALQINNGVQEANKRFYRTHVFYNKNVKSFWLPSFNDLVKTFYEKLSKEDGYNKGRYKNSKQGYWIDSNEVESSYYCYYELKNKEETEACYAYIQVTSSENPVVKRSQVCDFTKIQLSEDITEKYEISKNSIVFKDEDAKHAWDCGESFDTIADELISNLKKINEELGSQLHTMIENQPKNPNQEVLDLWERKKNLILQGAPGTGKTYVTASLAVDLLSNKHIADRGEVMTLYKQYSDEGRIQFVTFHQAMGYEDFVEGIKSEVINGMVNYTVKPGIFKQMCMLEGDLYKGKDITSLKGRDRVLIIDEINRGNISRIFGELITLIESDKRYCEDGVSSNENQLRVTLPLSKEQFYVPSNLFILGTMNTTDRSVGSIDYALRRRFAFYTVKSDKGKITNKNTTTKAQELFDKVKELITQYKLDADIEDLMVGHSYFMADSIEELDLKVRYEILPLLKEYYNDGIISKDISQDILDTWATTKK